MPTTEELQQQINQLRRALQSLADIHSRTHFIDKDVFSNPVYFNNKVLFKDNSSISLGANLGTKIGLAGERIGFLGASPIARQSAITPPSGGATVDSQARTAINSIITVLQNFGLTS